MSKSVGSPGSWNRLLGLVGIVFLLVVSTASPVFAGNDDEAGEEAAQAETKSQFQAEYRRLLHNAELLRQNAANARENYSKSRARRYPRGAASRQFLIDAEEAERELVEVEAEIERFKTNGQREGALPRWFYEVEDEPLGVARPAAPADRDPADLEGRNPLYLDDESRSPPRR